jgi:4-aminobutyrate aminotransferase/(S)-3-amino-2-methylpropionate transaminase
VVRDVEGRAFIDFAGGIGTMNVGHSHPKVVAAIQDQAARFTHTCFHVVMYGPYLELAERICRLTPGNYDKMALWLNSGAEAVENAVKAARYFTGRPAVICLDHAFHGRTLLGMSLTAKAMPYKRGFGPFAPEIYRIPAPYCYRCALGLEYPGCSTACAEELSLLLKTRLSAEDTAAFIAEPVLGEGGFIVPPKDYFQKVADICREEGIVFIADEIQSGMGRTGRMFALEHFEAEPDLITVAKSLAAGMPLSGVIGRKEILDAPHVGGLGGTFSGNPVSLRAALAVLDAFEEEDLLARARFLGQSLRARFDQWAQRYRIIGQVRGLGPMLGLELVKDRETKEPAPEETAKVLRLALERGLILLSCGTFGNVVRILAPLVISDQELEQGLAVMEEAIAETNKEAG